MKQLNALKILLLTVGVVTMGLTASVRAQSYESGSYYSQDSTKAVLATSYIDSEGQLVVASPPPPAVIEAIGATPPGYWWVSGYWDYDSDQQAYSWQQGYWARISEEATGVWVTPIWVHVKGYWRFKPAYWHHPGRPELENRGHKAPPVRVNIEVYSGTNVVLYRQYQRHDRPIETHREMDRRHEHFQAPRHYEGPRDERPHPNVEHRVEPSSPPQARPHLEHFKPVIPHDNRAAERMERPHHWER